MFRHYLCDTLFYEGDGKRLTIQYREALKPVKVDDRSGDEIAQDIINRLGLKYE